MKSIELKKISDEDNMLGFDKIELIDRELMYTYEYTIENQKRIGYHYCFVAIADGHIIRIDESEWESLYAYKTI